MNKKYKEIIKGIFIIMISLVICYGSGILVFKLAGNISLDSVRNMFFAFGIIAGSIIKEVLMRLFYEVRIR